MQGSPDEINPSQTPQEIPDVRSPEPEIPPPQPSQPEIPQPPADPAGPTGPQGPEILPGGSPTEIPGGRPL